MRVELFSVAALLQVVTQIQALLPYGGIFDPWVTWLPYGGRELFLSPEPAQHPGSSSAASTAPSPAWGLVVGMQLCLCW